LQIAQLVRDRLILVRRDSGIKGNALHARKLSQIAQASTNRML
jgi:hypothetical protein